MITVTSRAARFVLFVSAAVMAMPVAAAPARPAAAPALSAAILPVPLMPVVPAGQRLCSAKTASGLGTSMLKPSTQTARPAKADYALVNYIAYRATDGAVFDQNTAAAFPVDGVIPGFSEGLQLMAKGSIWRFCVPAALGYGAKGAGDAVPANADLVFQAELVDFKTAAEIEKMRAEAGAAQPGTPPQATPAPAGSPQP